MAPPIAAWLGTRAPCLLGHSRAPYSSMCHYLSELILSFCSHSAKRSWAPLQHQCNWENSRNKDTNNEEKVKKSDNISWQWFLECFYMSSWAERMRPFSVQTKLWLQCCIWKCHPVSETHCTLAMSWKLHVSLFWFVFCILKPRQWGSGTLAKMGWMYSSLFYPLLHLIFASRLFPINLNTL